MQTFEENDIIDKNESWKVNNEDDLVWVYLYAGGDDSGNVTIERSDGKIKLYKPSFDQDGNVTDSKATVILGSNDSESYDIDFFETDIEGWCLMEGYEGGETELEISFDGEEDKGKITVCGGTDLTIHNGGSDLDNGESSGPQGAVVPDNDEEIVGAYLLVNWDDDDADGNLTTENGWVADPVPDLQENYVASEDNLAKLVLNIIAIPPDGTYELEVVSGANKIKFWVTSTKLFEINKRTWDMTSAYDKSELQNYINNGIWIEGIEASTAERDVEIILRYYDNSGIEKSSDTVKATVIMLNLGAGVCRAMALFSLEKRGHAGLLTKFNGSCTPIDFRNSSLYTVHEMQLNPDCCVTPTWKAFHDSAVYWDEYGYDLTHIQRLKILQTAKWVESRGVQNINYSMAKVLEPDDWAGQLNTLNKLRCDGIVEFCYEWNEINLFGKKPTPTSAPHYSIVDYTEEHNEGTMNFYFFWPPHLYPATQCGHENSYQGTKWETMFDSINIIKPDIGSINW